MVEGQSVDYVAIHGVKGGILPYPPVACILPIRDRGSPRDVAATKAEDSTRTHIHGYKALPIPIPGGYPYALGTQLIDQILYTLLTFFTFIDSILRART
jgi:hypothetical protein